jgi:hypothetical protein
VKNPLAGLKAKVLWRTADGSTALEVDDPNDDVMVIVHPDGTMLEERIVGLKDLSEAWESGSAGRRSVDPAFDLVPGEPAPARAESRSVPEQFVGRNKPELAPEPEPEPVEKRQKRRERAEPVAAVSADVEKTARIVAIQVHQRQVKPRSDFYPHSTPTADADAWIAYAVGQQWILEDGDLLRAGPLSPYLDDPIAEGMTVDKPRGWLGLFR